jgi:cell division protein FtsW
MQPVSGDAGWEAPAERGSAPPWSWRRRVVDWLEESSIFGKLLISLVVLLTAIGTVMVFSASFYEDGVDGNAFLYLRRHLLWIPLAALAAMVACQFNYRLLARWYPWLYIATVALLALVWVPNVGILANKSYRWVRIGSLQFQPSELAKLTAMAFVAGFLSSDPRRLASFRRGFLPLVGGILALFGLILAEPDLGTAMFVLGLAGFLTVLSGMRKRYLLLSALVFAPIVAGYVYVRWDMIEHRLLGFLDYSKVYQVKHSILGLGSGGWLGLGLGAGKQKLHYLPEPHTDFIFSVVGEELGFLGSLGILILFVALLWVSIAITRRVKDYFGFLLASGITVSIALQAATNIAVVTASVPTKGIPLPFLTFGGSGLSMTFVQIGLLLAIDRQSRRLDGAWVPPAATEAALIPRARSLPPAPAAALDELEEDDDGRTPR